MNRSEGISYPVADTLAAAWAGVRERLAAWFEARGRTLAIRQLQQLSERTLRDIGLERADIFDAVHRGRRS